MSLEFSLNPSAPTDVATDCVIVGAFADQSLAPAAQAIDAASGGKLKALIARGDVSGKTGSTALLHDLPGVTAPRVLVIGLGDGRDAGWNIRQAVVAAAHACYRYTATLGTKNKKRDETGLKALAITGDDSHA